MKQKTDIIISVLIALVCIVLLLFTVFNSQLFFNILIFNTYRKPYVLLFYPYFTVIVLLFLLIIPCYFLLFFPVSQIKNPGHMAGVFTRIIKQFLFYYRQFLRVWKSIYRNSVDINPVCKAANINRNFIPAIRLVGIIQNVHHLSSA